MDCVEWWDKPLGHSISEFLLESEKTICKKGHFYAITNLDRNVSIFLPVEFSGYLSVILVDLIDEIQREGEDDYGLTTEQTQRFPLIAVTS